MKNLIIPYTPKNNVYSSAIFIGTKKKLNILHDMYTSIVFFNDVRIIDMGIKHDAIVNIDNVLMGSSEVEYKTARVKAINIPL